MPAPLAAIIISAALAGIVPSVRAQANVTGTWQTLTTTMPINPVHVALMHTGKVLVVSGSGNYPPDTDYTAAIWDPANDTVTTMPITWDMFCNGMVVMPDGRPFVMGGTLQYDPFYGQQKTSAFDPITETFADQQSMADGRWYPTSTVLADGRVMVFSGLGLTGNTNTTVEFFTLGAGWSVPYTAPWTPPLYPRMHVLPDGNVFYSGPTTSSSLFNPLTQTWTMNIANTQYSGTRTYGSSVLMPLTPANGFKPRVMIFGGGNPATDTTEIIDLSVATPAWTYGVPMSQARIEMNTTILPSGQILATGGSINDEDATTESLNADIYDPDTGARTSAGANSFARLYHSNSLLLPDATVLLLGSNPERGTYEPYMEIYTPAYLYNSDGTHASRPRITNVSSSVLGYNTSFTIHSPFANHIASVVLIRAGTPTHSFDMDQRMVGLSFTLEDGKLNVMSPANGNLAPPGYYLLFILNSSGVPSVAKFVQLMTNPGKPPTGTITSPSSNITVAVGQSLSFAGTGTSSAGSIAGYDWVFPGGTPASSSAATGTVSFATPGTYVASLTVTDNSGRTDPNPPTTTITVVPSTSLSTSTSLSAPLSASPSSAKVAVGGGVNETAPCEKRYAVKECALE
ncbi:MAG TPA: galactose oxidase-like domain-containing protein [Candidatus Acidoferrales bacterium]